MPSDSARPTFERHERPTALGLSDRERSVLALMASGATNPEIAAELHLSKHTIKEHTSAVYRKLGVRNRTEAVDRAQRLGLASLRRRLGMPGDSAPLLGHALEERHQRRDL